MTYLKIGAAVFLLGICSFYVWNYHHLQSKVAAQKIEIDNLKLVQGVLEKKQEAVDAYIAKREDIRKRVNYEQKQIDKDVATVDDTGLAGLYDRYRVRQASPGNPADGPSRGAKHPPPGKAGTGPLH